MAVLGGYEDIRAARGVWSLLGDVTAADTETLMLAQGSEGRKLCVIVCTLTSTRVPARKSKG